MDRSYSDPVKKFHWKNFASLARRDTKVQRTYTMEKYKLVQYKNTPNLGTNEPEETKLLRTSSTPRYRPDSSQYYTL